MTKKLNRPPIPKTKEVGFLTRIEIGRGTVDLKLISIRHLDQIMGPTHSFPLGLPTAASSKDSSPTILAANGRNWTVSTL